MWHLNFTLNGLLRTGTLGVGGAGQDWRRCKNFVVLNLNWMYHYKCLTYLIFTHTHTHTHIPYQWKSLETMRNQEAMSIKNAQIVALKYHFPLKESSAPRMNDELHVWSRNYTRSASYICHTGQQGGYSILRRELDKAPKGKDITILASIKTVSSVAWKSSDMFKSKSS